MLLFLAIILIIVAIVFDICEKRHPDSDFENYLFNIHLISLFLGFILLLGTIPQAIINYATVDASIAKYNQTYDAIMYKMESEACRDEFGILSKEVIDEAQEWNEDLAVNKELQDNFWIGNLIPDIYDQFEFIDLSSYKK